MKNQVKTVLAFTAIFLLVVLLYSQYNYPIQNSGSVEMIQDNMQLNQLSSNYPETEPLFEETNSDMNNVNSMADYQVPQSEYLNNKFNNRNSSQGEFKKSSYSGSLRGSNIGPSEFDSYFDDTNNVISGSQSGINDQFIPNMDNNGTAGHAAFKSTGKSTCGSNQNCEPEDLFDIEKVLPQEVNDDWFEVQPEPISVKNRHLINIAKPVGVNTIGTTKRNSSYDLRGTPACPKTVISPWLQSSIEPDTNLRGYLG